MTKRRPGVVRFDRISLETSSEMDYDARIGEDDPSSAVNEMRRTETIARPGWKVRIETSMRLSCTRTDFRVTASVWAFEGQTEVCHREWDCSIPRDFL